MTQELQIATFVCNFIEENCYVVSDATGEAVIIDCGAFAEAERAEIAAYIEKHKLRVVHLLNTHGHFDHVFGVQWAADTFGLRPEMHVDEAWIYENAAQQMEQFLHRSFPLSLPPAAPGFREGDSRSFGTHRLDIIHTPGHTPGGVCFYEASGGVLFSGDSLFRRSIGRCDLPGGDWQALVGSLRAKVLTLPAEVCVYPGHGPATTVGEEARSNPEL